MRRYFGIFETCLLTINHALESQKTKVKKLETLKDELKTNFYEFDSAFRVYKAEVVAKDSDTVGGFNGKAADGSDNFACNDSWAKEQLKIYLEAVENIEEKLEELELEVAPANASVNEIEDQNLVFHEELTSEKDNVSKSILEFSNQVEVTETFSWTNATVLEKISEKLRARLEMIKIKSRGLEEKERGDFLTFFNTESVKLDSVHLKLSMKISAAPMEGSGGEFKKQDERVHLEKSKPPKFNGDITEYPEFKRKWQNIVGKASLPELSEIERLKENIPSDARGQLYGVETKVKAWKVLDTRYGDVNLIAKKLKSQLKSIRLEGKTDPEKIISLHVKVTTIVTKLDTLKMGDALKFDSEFLSAVFCALPSKHQTRWLDYEKGNDHWADMLKFLSRAYEQANDELSLLSIYEADEKKNPAPFKSPSGKAFGAKLEDATEEDVENSKEKARKRSQEYCGKCPLCGKQHTWTRKSGDKWPSDRFLSCRKFNDLSVAARGQQIQKSNGCPRCLSWNHGRDNCKMKKDNCNNDLPGGVKCKGDHSKLVCGSGVPYCAAALTKSAAEPNPISSQERIPVGEQVEAESEFGNLDEIDDTIFYLQDIPVVGCEEEARVFWDDGSNRVFIREQYAEKMGLRK